MLGLVLVFSDIPRELGIYSYGQPGRQSWDKDSPEAGQDRLKRWLEWRPEGSEGWGQKSPLGVGQPFMCAGQMVLH